MRHLQVTGHGTATTTPDVMWLHAGASAIRADAASAMAQVTRALIEVAQVLDRRQIAKADRQTTSVQVRPEWAWVDNTQVLQGYRVSQDLSIRIRDVEATGEVLTELIEATGDAIRVDDVVWDVDDKAPLREQARRAAIADARERATTYADAAGVQLGDVLRIAEQESAAGMMPMAASAKSMPMQEGSVDLEATVSVTWELL